MRIELVSRQQHESLVDLLCELHSFYNNGASVRREMVRSHLVENLLGADSPLILVVAVRKDETVAGFAAIALTYSLVDPSPDLRRHCQLKELYVRASERSQSVGKAIMSWVAQYAIKNNCCRIDWPVKAANSRGISFYERLGATQVVERLSFRLSEPGLTELASQSTYWVGK